MKVIVARGFQLLVFFPLYFILKAYFGFEVRGRDNLKGITPRDGVIYAANHSGMFDGVITAVAIAMPWNGYRLGSFLPIRYLAFQDYFSWIQTSGPFPFPISPFVAIWLRLSACIPVKRRRKEDIGKVYVEDVLSSATDALNRGERVFIFPEGKMSKDGRLQKAKRGVTCLHKETGAPIVPIHISGTFKMLSWKNLFSSERRVVINIGVPMKNMKIRPEHDLHDMAIGANIVMEKIRELSSQTEQVIVTKQEEVLNEC